VPVRGLTPEQAIELIGRIRGQKKAEAGRRASGLLERLELTEWRGRVLTELSGGVVRLVAFCMAAVAPGRVVILDEPTNDVDPLRRKLLWREVRALADAGSAVLLVTHNVLEAERCVDRLAIVDRGLVVGQGTPATLKRDLGSALRLEVVFDPTTTPPDAPPFVTGGVMVGRRFVGDLQPGDLTAAVGWARGLQDVGLAEEFSIGPATLEDVYVRRVRQDASREEAHAAAAG
jgi:ABC-2 type transport system ATP-binding protein